MTNKMIVQEDGAKLQQHEVATAQAQAMARSQIEAQYLVAERHPRNMDRVRQLILKECKRSTFAAEAVYSLPRGGKRIEGLSIRFAEGIRRVYGNMLTQDAIIYEDDSQQIIRVTAIDFETNSVAMSDVSVPKFVEKRSPAKGDEVVGGRTNSQGQTVYKVRATDDDMRIKRNAEAARARRNRILELVPADLRDECMRQCQATIKASTASDPDAYRKQIIDGFTTLGVPADELGKYLGHDLASASPDELAELRIVFQTVRDGEATWHECLAAKTGVADDGEEDPHRELKKKLAERVANVGKKRAKKSAKSKPKGDGLTDEQRDQGWEIDQETGEVIPPAGYAG